MPYTSLNGNMFSFIDKEQNLNLRLAAADREEYVKRFNSPPSVQHGIVMKEYVILTPEVLRNENLLKEYFQRSLTYVATLKAKATKNK